MAGGSEFAGERLRRAASGPEIAPSGEAKLRMSEQHLVRRQLRKKRWPHHLRTFIAIRACTWSAAHLVNHFANHHQFICDNPAGQAFASQANDLGKSL